MVISSKFTLSAPVIASYDFFDFSSSIGRKNFYGLIATDNLILTTDSNTRSKASNGTGAEKKYVEGTSIDSDLDFTFKRQMIVNGNAVLTFSALQRNTSGSVQNVGFDVTATVYHVTSTGTETSLGNETEAYTAANIGGNTTRFSEYTLIIPLTRKSLLTNEKLRLNIAMTKTGSNNGSVNIGFCADPLNSTVTIDSTSADFSELKINVPFEII